MASSVSRGRKVHVAATSFVALFATVGFGLYGLSFFYDFMVRDLGWSRATVTSGNAVGKVLVGPAFGFVAGWLVDRFGPRRLMLVGLLLGGFALAGLGFVSALPLFYLFFVLNALGYVCGGPLPNQVLLSRFFDRSRGKAMGFAYVGIGVGGAVAPRLAHALTEAFGWNLALATMGGLFILLTWPMAWFLLDAPRTEATTAPAAAPPIGPVLRQPAFYLLAIGSMGSIAAVGGTMLNLKLFLALDRKLSQADSASLLSLVLLSSIVGRLLVGALADRFQKKHVMLGVYLIVALSVPLLLVPAVPLALFAVLFGLGLGGDYMIIPLMAAELFGVKVLGRVMGLVLTADGLAEALAPWAVGALRDSTGSYAPGFLLLVGLAALGAVAVAFLPQRRLQA